MSIYCVTSLLGWIGRQTNIVSLNYLKTRLNSIFIFASNLKFLRMKRTFGIVALVLSFSILVKADEGMWLPMHLKRLNEVDMQ